MFRRREIILERTLTNCWVSLEPTITPTGPGQAETFPPQHTPPKLCQLYCLLQFSCIMITNYLFNATTHLSIKFILILLELDI